MALDQSGTLTHSVPIIALLVLCPLVLVMVVVYYLVIYPVRKDRHRRKEKQDSDNVSPSTSSLTGEAPRRELHRWIPSLPTPTTPRFSSVPTTPRLSPVPPTPGDSTSGFSSRIGSLSLTPSDQTTRPPSPYSLPRSGPDVLPPSNVASNVAAPLTPPPSAMIIQSAIGHIDSWSYLEQDPFADPGLPNVQGARPNPHANPHTRGSLVTVPTPAASIRSSVDRMSATTSSTLPPSYCTHRPTHRTASDAPFSSHERLRNMARTAVGSYGPTSYQARSDHPSRHSPRKSVDGGVRLEGGPLDPPREQGPENPPRYRKK